jgi:hypothetical protein
LVCQKDRNGTYARGQTVADVAITSTGNGPGSVAVTVTRHEGTNRPTTLMARVSGYLERLDGWASQSAIERAVTGKAAGLRLAITALVSEGFVAMEVRAGQGAGSYFRHVQRFADQPATSDSANNAEGEVGPRLPRPHPVPTPSPENGTTSSPRPHPPKGGTGRTTSHRDAPARHADHHQPPFPAAEEPADQSYRLLP